MQITITNASVTRSINPPTAAQANVQPPTAHRKGQAMGAQGDRVVNRNVSSELVPTPGSLVEPGFPTNNVVVVYIGESVGIFDEPKAINLTAANLPAEFAMARFTNWQQASGYYMALYHSQRVRIVRPVPTPAPGNPSNPIYVPSTFPTPIVPRQKKRTDVVVALPPNPSASVPSSAALSATTLPTLAISPARTPNDRPTSSLQTPTPAPRLNRKQPGAPDSPSAVVLVPDTPARRVVFIDSSDEDDLPQPGYPSACLAPYVAPLPGHSSADQASEKLSKNKQKATTNLDARRRRLRIIEASFAAYEKKYGSGPTASDRACNCRMTSSPSSVSAQASGSRSWSPPTAAPATYSSPGGSSLSHPANFPRARASYPRETEDGSESDYEMPSFNPVEAELSDNEMDTSDRVFGFPMEHRSLED